MTILYSTGCPKCKVLIKKLDMAHIEYTICDCKEIMLNKGFTTIPMIENDDGIVMDFKAAVDWINNINTFIEARKV